AIAGSFLAGAPALASPESQRLIEDGATQLKAGDIAGAEDSFSRALVADPDDYRAALLRGVALNRLGRHAAALGSLDYARLGGVTGARLDYETGWAAVAVGDWQRAVDALEAYEAERPGDGKTSEFLGRAWLGLGDLDKAEAALREAMKRDPALTDTATLALAEVESRRGELADARRMLSDVADGTDDARVGAIAREALQQSARAQVEDKPWTAYLGIGVGKDTNVIALSDDIVAPADITDKKSAFMRFNAGATYTYLLGDADALTFGYDGEYTRYTSVDDQNSLSNGIRATLRHAIYNEVVATMTVGASQDDLAGHRFRRGYSMRPALQIQPIEELIVEPFLGWSQSDYSAPTSNPAALDRDSIARSAGINAYFTIPGTDVTFDAGYARIQNDAKGTDYDYSTNSYSIGVTAGLPYEFTGEMRYSRAHSHYANLNSLAPTSPPGPNGFGFRREDVSNARMVRLSRPITDNIVGYFQYDDIDAGSNIDVYDYDRRIAVAGIVYQF
ncbi:unnamed protein product, partial [Discosporangium mesarthrocarpum]